VAAEPQNLALPNESSFGLRRRNAGIDVLGRRQFGRSLMKKRREKLDGEHK